MRARREPRVATDRGTTLVEVVVGLFLVALAATMLARLMTSTARSAPEDTVGPDVGLAIDVFTSDVREAASVEVDIRRGRVDSVTLQSGTGEVRWTFDRDDLQRDDGSRPTPRTMAVGLDGASTFVLYGAADAVIDPRDSDAVRWCTRLVEIVLSGPEVDSNRSAALRVGDPAGSCP